MKIDGCNAELELRKAFYLPTANAKDLPVLVELEVQIDTYKSVLHVPMDQLTLKHIKKQCPILRFRNKKASASFDDTLISALIEGLNNGTIQRGYYFEKAGAITFPDGHIGFLRGSELIGMCNCPFALAPSIQSIHLLGEDTPFSQFVPLLLSSPLQVFPVFSYVLLTSIRSLLIENGIDLQAVLYIVGGQGLGKTTLATRIAGIYTKDGKTTGIVQAGSTLAAVNTLILNSRDQPVIIDDLCLSASRDTARKRVDLASKLIRQGTGCVPIIKKCGNDIKELPCEAGLIMTAEFPLENLSDLTRCIIIPVLSRLDIPDDLTPAIVGAAVRHYSHWFSRHVDDEIVYFQQAIKEKEDCDIDARIFTNYTCLNIVFSSFLRSLDELGISSHLKKQSIRKMNKALDSALKKQHDMIDTIKSRFPKGNLAYCIVNGFKGKKFDLTDDIEKLHKHDGIMWKEDLCLKHEVLIRFIHQQSGYQKWSSHQIAHDLNDIGALVLQEENAFTVHLTKGSPRVYRIRLKTLKKHSKRYKGENYYGV
ncbi:MAG: hypothetical protein IJ955_08530 [Oscillospiraceae bacterium]|nr:hypothetical protein [Oscillospiraceae bacterium]